MENKSPKGITITNEDNNTSLTIDEDGNCCFKKEILHFKIDTELADILISPWEYKWKNPEDEKFPPETLITTEFVSILREFETLKGETINSDAKKTLEVHMKKVIGKKGVTKK